MKCNKSRTREAYGFSLIRLEAAFAVICLAVALLWLCTGCGKSESQITDSEQLPDNAHTIYYVNGAGDELLPVTYLSNADDSNHTLLATELINAMYNPESLEGREYKGKSQPDSDSNQYFSALSEEQIFTNITIESRVARVRFSAYTPQDPAREVLCRAAITYALTGIEGIDYVYMMVGEQPLMEGNQTPVGFLTASDFVYLVGKNVNAYTRSSMILYFASEDGTELMGEEIDVTYSNTFSIEQYVVDRLIEGPDSPNLQPVIPDTARALSISVKDGTCYVNFDDSFITNALDLDARLPVYAIVNSLTELPNINNVQITINGSSEVMFKDTISLNMPLERDLDFYGGLVY